MAKNAQCTAVFGLALLPAHKKSFAMNIPVYTTMNVVTISPRQTDIA
jgi:hypothetical protein